jgi:hypothetical protein
MAEETANLSSEIEELRRTRHAALSTALPFPILDWTDKTRDKENLIRLRDYSESLANSAMDWYLQHQKLKKRFAWTLHFFMYFFVGLAGLFPLLKISYADLSSVLSSNTVATLSALSNHAAEIAVVSAGIAGLIKLLDTNWGFTVDWMRFFSTATRINKELMKFRFDWDGLDLGERSVLAKAGAIDNSAHQSAEATSNKDTQTPAGDKPPTDTKVTNTDAAICPTCKRPLAPPDPSELRRKLASDFCLTILDIVGAEISVWADELKKRMDQIDARHPGQNR